MCKLFNDMNSNEKIAHIENQIIETREHCDSMNIFNAEVLDFLDYWVPWLLDEIERLKEIEFRYDSCSK